MPLPLHLVKLARPYQWVKNVFVVAPLFFSGQITNPSLWLVTLGALAVFCLISSTVYVLNDVVDAPSDRKHAKKKHRPVASGKVKVPQALAFGAVLLALAVGLGMLVIPGPMGWLILAAYTGINLAYSLRLKQVPVLEWFLLSSGFLFRLLFGAVVLGVALSPWICLCTWLLAMMLAVGKRRTDMAQDEHAHTKRPVLRHYTLPYLDAVNLILATATFTAYVMFCVSDYAVARFGEMVMLSVPLVLFGLLDYLRLVTIENKGDDPTLLCLKEPSLQICVLLFGLLFLGLLYG